MDITSNHLDVVARGGFGWREEVDDGEEVATCQAYGDFWSSSREECVAADFMSDTYTQH